MPELPDLEVIREYLGPRLPGVSIAAAQVRRPIIVRNLLGDDFAAHMTGLQFADVRRRGKFLLLGLDDGTALVINPMLAGRLRYGEPLKKDRVRDALVLRLADGRELRYHDAEDMGKIYLTLDLGQIPTFLDLGPEANDPDLTLDIFLQRLRRHPGEIKGILTNQEFVAGIGNAYADEICWRAGIYPFRRRPSLGANELAGSTGRCGQCWPRRSTRFGFGSGTPSTSRCATSWPCMANRGNPVPAAAAPSARCRASAATRTSAGRASRG